MQLMGFDSLGTVKILRRIAKMKSRKYTVVFTSCLIVWLLAGSLFARDIFPGKRWIKYAAPEEAGFSSQKLAAARAYYDSTQAAALFVVYKGVVIADWGESARRFHCHSARKSLMSGMYGIFIDNGVIDTNLTLEQLGIDEAANPLTEEEKKARIADLLAARSGIYLLAAYEPASNPKPPRGSFAPGTNWCYNNWDFNTLLTILEQQTKTKFFDEFDKYFAKPLQMQDYTPSCGYYHFEREKSEHPAYPFRMSARDMARFGLLYLNHGKWNGKQILSEEYIARSTSRISEDSWIGAYGYLWWLYDAEPFKSLGMYSALGVGEQTIHVIPGADMVFVLRTNTYVNDQVTREQHLKLVQLFLDAMTGKASANPRLVEVPEPKPSFTALSITKQEMESYVGDYVIPEAGFAMKVSAQGDNLALDFGAGLFTLRKLGPGHFITEDMLEHFYFENDASGKKQITSISVLGAKAGALESMGRFAEALKVLSDAEEHFGSDPAFQQYMGDAYFYLASQKLDSALSRYGKWRELDSSQTLGNTALAWSLPQVYGQVFPPDTSATQLQRFVGKYGPRSVRMEEGQLIYKREGRDTQTRLIRLTESIFELEGSTTARFQFHTDETGRVDKIIGIYQDGRRDETPRDQ
jgi:CubicO group peptidase (beta-lactamase class C family)